MAKNELKEAEEEFKRVYRYIVKEFYEFGKILTFLEEDDPKDALKRLRGLFSVERVIRRENKLFEEAEKHCKKALELYENGPGSNELRRMLQQAEVYNNFFTKEGARGGVIETALKKARKDKSAIPDAIKDIRMALKGVPSFEEEIKLIEEELRKIDSAFTHSVKEVELQVGKIIEGLEALDKRKKELEKREEELSGKKTWKESWFGGIFGDKKILSDHQKSAAALEELNGEINVIQEKRGELVEKLFLIIEEHLHVNDPVFFELKKIFEEIKRVDKIVVQYYNNVVRTLNSVKTALHDESMDMLSSNKGISILSSMSNNTVSKNLGELKEITPVFEQEIQDYAKFVGDIPKIGDFEFVDLSFDFSSGGMDLTSFFVFKRLESAENKLEKLLKKVKAILEKVRENKKGAEKNVKNYLEEVRHKL